METLKVSNEPHHTRSKVATDRCKYRRGHRETAVKAFTIAHESKYLLIHNVPDINAHKELMSLCKCYGQIEYLKIADYPICDAFTHVYAIKYKRFINAISAKKCLDDKNFMGSVLHVCYAPEMESVEDTEEKLYERRKYVHFKLSKINSMNSKNSKNSKNFSKTDNCYNVNDVNDVNVNVNDVNVNVNDDTDNTNDIQIDSLHSDSLPIKCNEKDESCIKTKESKKTVKRQISDTNDETFHDNQLIESSKKSKITPKIKWRINKR